MPIIELQTRIKSSQEICFDLSRSIDLHQISTVQTNEKAIEGVTKGLINGGEFVTWQATHFGIKQKLTSRITAFERPFHFRDEQIKGVFKFIIHDHFFERNGSVVIMKDVFNFEAPFGILGSLVEKFILIDYMKKLLVKRNEIIKDFAETEKWKMVFIKETF